MKRILVLLAVLLAPSWCAASQVFELTGEITGGMFLGPFPVDFNDPPVTPEFPIPYTALLTYQPEISQARFEFTADDGGVPIHHIVGSVVGESSTGNIFPGIEQFDAAAILVDYLSSPAAFITSFDLALDRATSQGSWQWHEECPVCFAALPAANATITSFRLVPEPNAAVYALLVLVAPWARLIRRNS